MSTYAIVLPVAYELLDNTPNELWDGVGLAAPNIYREGDHARLEWEVEDAEEVSEIHDVLNKVLKLARF